MQNKSLLLPVLLVLAALTRLSAQEASLQTIPVGLENLAAGGDLKSPGQLKTMVAGSAGQTAPEFANLDAYIAGHLSYPEAARENGLEGQVRLRLVIGPDGRVEDAQVVDGLGLGCDEAARTLALNMPAWTPATQSGIPVRSRAMIALNFRIR